MKERLGILDQDYSPKENNRFDIDDESLHALCEEETDCHEDFSDIVTANEFLSRVAQDTVDEFNTFMFVNTTDELIELVKNPTFMSRFENTKVSHYFFFENRAYYKTIDNKLQEVTAYIRGLENSFLPFSRQIVEDLTIKDHLLNIKDKIKKEINRKFGKIRYKIENKIYDIEIYIENLKDKLLRRF